MLKTIDPKNMSPAESKLLAAFLEANSQKSVFKEGLKKFSYIDQEGNTQTEEFCLAFTTIRRKRKSGKEGERFEVKGILLATGGFATGEDETGVFDSAGVLVPRADGSMIFKKKAPGKDRVIKVFRHLQWLQPALTHALMQRVLSNRSKEPVIEDGLVYHVMGKAEGEELTKIICGTFPEILALGRELLVALKELHDEKIKHKDIKPENIVVKPLRDKNPHAKIIDFDMSLDVNADDRDKPCGTKEYMSVEAKTGKKTDAKTDICSIGKVLWELMGGEFDPFHIARHGTLFAGFEGKLNINAKDSNALSDLLMRMMSYLIPTRPSLELSIGLFDDLIARNTPENFKKSQQAAITAQKNLEAAQTEENFEIKLKKITNLINNAFQSFNQNDAALLKYFINNLGVNNFDGLTSAQIIEKIPAIFAGFKNTKDTLDTTLNLLKELQGRFDKLSNATNKNKALGPVEIALKQITTDLSDLKNKHNKYNTTLDMMSDYGLRIGTTVKQLNARLAKIDLALNTAEHDLIITALDDLEETYHLLLLKKNKVDVLSEMVARKLNLTTSNDPNEEFQRLCADFDRLAKDMENINGREKFTEEKYQELLLNVEALDKKCQFFIPGLIWVLNLSTQDKSKIPPDSSESILQDPISNAQLQGLLAKKHLAMLAQLEECDPFARAVLMKRVLDNYLGEVSSSPDAIKEFINRVGIKALDGCDNKKMVAETLIDLLVTFSAYLESLQHPVTAFKSRLARLEKRVSQVNQNELTTMIHKEITRLSDLYSNSMPVITVKTVDDLVVAETRGKLSTVLENAESELLELEKKALYVNAPSQLTNGFFHKPPSNLSRSGSREEIVEEQAKVLTV